ncbi:MAG: phosphate-binding protein, partial [Gammaproteobacteria bacterium]|nr:phosphate-binding protein [Gammaproteobacteria bacterium]
EATAENASGDYPLARFLYVYINKNPNRPLDPMAKEFVKMVLSKAGQGVVLRDGYVPLPASVTSKTLKELGIE